MMACDFEPRAVKTYQMNFPDVPVLQEDIRKVTGRRVEEWSGVPAGELEILDGSPPCTPFSTCGLREKSWGKTYVHTADSKAQRSDDLFFEFIRLIGEVKPKAFSAENVGGLVKGLARGYYNEIVRGMKSLGYRVTPFLLDASDFGVPQVRNRIFITGVRNDVRTDETVALKKHGKKIGFAQAVRGLEVGKDTLMAARAALANSRMGPAYSLLGRAGSMSRIHPKGHWFNYSRTRLDEPVPTVLASNHNLLHPTEPRYLTLPELKRCATFPDSFRFLSPSDGWARIGNSVPPKLTKAVAEYIVEKCGFV